MSKTGKHEILTGDATDLPFDDRSFHAVVTDPPYNFGDAGFMSKDWDNIGEPLQYQKWCHEWGEEALRVLKPGGHMLAFSGSHSFHRLMCGVEDAGFEVRTVVMWLFGGGFPKGQSVDKSIQKFYQDVDPEEVKEADLGFANNDEWNQLDTQEIMPDPEGVAKKWSGWKSALKPSFEPIVLARKPLEEDAIYKQVMATGTGALNIDGCRIGTETRTNPPTSHNDNCYSDAGNRPSKTVNGRYPANLVLDEEAAEMLDEQSGVSVSSGGQEVRGFGSSDKYAEGEDRRYDSDPGFGDKGGASRYFYTTDGGTPKGREGEDSADNRYEEEGSTNFAAKPGRRRDTPEQKSRFYYTSKAQKSERTVNGKIENDHATVKPVDLMEWLVKLVTAEDQLVLDPFVGSGTTIVACENTHRRCVGVDKQRKWVDLSKKRIAAERNLLENDPVDVW